MSLREALLIALRGLRAHRLRSALTMIGLIIGVAAVIVLVACGQGVRNSVSARIEPVANLITIVAQAANVPGGPPAQSLTDADAAALSNAPEIDHRAFQVIGAMQSYGQQSDNTAVMPLSTARHYIVGHGVGIGDILNQITVQAPQQAAVPAAMSEVTRILNARHHISNPRMQDFQVQSLGHRLQTFNQVVSILTLFTPAVAAISLVVGGIGVLNIMLVSVTERTREIGIRKAIGATSRAILEQFLIESIVLAGLGGLVGVGVGIGLSLLAGAIAPTLDPASGVFSGFVPVLSVLPVAVSFGISLAIGLIAGGYPAYRAAQLRPIQALRYS